MVNKRTRRNRNNGKTQKRKTEKAKRRGTIQI